MAMKNALKEIALQKQMQLLQMASQLPIDPNTKQPLFDFTELAKHIVNTMDLPPNVLYNDEKLKQQMAQNQQMEQQAAQQQAQQPAQQP